MDGVDLEQLQTFVPPGIFTFLAAGNEPHHTTPTEVEHPNPLEAELVANPLKEGLDALLLACSDMYKLNSEAAEPNANIQDLSLLMRMVNHLPPLLALPKTQQNVQG